MDIQGLKIELKDWLLSLKDIRTLQAIDAIRKNKAGLDEFSEELKTLIDEAVDQVGNKQTISHQKMMEDTKNKYPQYFGN